MTLPPPGTAPVAIRYLARMVAAGTRYGRGVRAREAREHCAKEMKRIYDAAPDDECAREVFGAASRTATYLPIGKAQRVCRVVFPTPDAEVPRTWRAQFFERVCWPPDEPTASTPVFRLYLEVGRGEQRPVILPVHDMRDPWKGPSFKSRWLHKLFPVNPHLPVQTWLVYGDRLGMRALCQWLTVLFAQRTLLTPAEEDAAVNAFFRVAADPWSEKRLLAYLQAKKRFVRPIAGWPSFSSYLSRTATRLMVAEADPKRDAGVSGSYIALRTLRTSAPQLHRAILDRIRSGKVQTIVFHDNPYVSHADVDAVDQERLANAERRAVKGFPGKRANWINRMIAKGMSRASATRKLKRWMNTLDLSADEIEASITKGRLVRAKPTRETK